MRLDIKDFTIYTWGQDGKYKDIFYKEGYLGKSDLLSLSNKFELAKFVATRRSSLGETMWEFHTDFFSRRETRLWTYQGPWRRKTFEEFVKLLEHGSVIKKKIFEKIFE